MGNKSCCFTGHRNVPEGKALEEEVKKILADLIENHGVTDFYCGGAMGFDMVSEVAVAKMGYIYPQVKLHLVLPCPPAHQTAKWSEHSKKTYELLMNKADSVEIVSDRYYNGCMKKRNQRLIDLSDYCICYYDESNPYSGTGQTVRMAEKKGIKIINLFSK